MPKIYTKTGDQGETSLPGGKRVKKSCITLRVVGEVDELNSVLGLVVVLLNESEGLRGLAEFVTKIQRDLFKVGAELAALQMSIDREIKKIGESEVAELESQIDRMWSELPELKNFILPGGSLAGANLHQARTICRRTERALVELDEAHLVRPELKQYFNRLSDFLFAAARWANKQLGKSEPTV